jgi:hypothetical protein
MKLLKVEDHNDYLIIYVNDNEKYDVYRRLSEINWEIFRRNEWKPLQDYFELEKMFNEQNIKK